MKRVKILGVSSSIRSRSNVDRIKEQLSAIKTREELGYFFEKIAMEKTASNTEACLIAALYGCLKEGAEIELIRLNRYYPVDNSKTITKEKEAELVSIARECDGMIISTPVYFGDRSSYAESFIRLMREKDCLKGKIIGVISVGAKRNGGQETTNIFTLWEVLSEGALVCGNGPKTAQYGGTGWAGDVGVIREDDFGLDTSIGVGHRVAQIANLLSMGKDTDLNKFTLSFWIVKDKDGIMKKNVQDRIDYLKSKYPPWVNYRIIDLTDKRFKRCLACNICPHYFNEPERAMKDKIQDDDMNVIFGDLVGTDAVIIAGYNPLNTSDMSDVYQVFTERTRFIRRDNFILTNVPITAYSLEEMGQTSLFGIKAMTSYLRHNAIILPTITQYIGNGAPLNTCDRKFDDFLTTALSIGRGREQSRLRDVSYEAVGYNAKDFDHKTTKRK